MKRKWIEISKINIYDEMHKMVGMSFEVDKAKDGKSTEEHKEGIRYMKKVIESGEKLMPILVSETLFGRYDRLDGFKRCLSHQELGYDYIEAFVCTAEEYANQRDIPFLDWHIKCYKGGQPKEKFPLFEGVRSKDDDYTKVEFLYKGDKINIEIRENVHIHWGEAGIYRLEMGRKDFLELAEAMGKIE